jgi:hypothetical protein
VKRHYANNFLDPKRQLIINLFLGIYKPYDPECRPSDWTIQGEWKLMQKLNEKVNLPEMNAKKKWWETALRKFEPTLPEPLRKDLDFLFSLGIQPDIAAKLNRDLHRQHNHETALFR